MSILDGRDFASALPPRNGYFCSFWHIISEKNMDFFNQTIDFQDDLC
jgi:hypothetical protein